MIRALLFSLSPRCITSHIMLFVTVPHTSSSTAMSLDTLLVVIIVSLSIGAVIIIGAMYCCYAKYVLQINVGFALFRWQMT